MGRRARFSFRCIPPLFAVSLNCLTHFSITLDNEAMSGRWRGLCGPPGGNPAVGVDKRRLREDRKYAWLGGSGFYETSTCYLLRELRGLVGRDAGFGSVSSTSRSEPARRANRRYHRDRAKAIGERGVRSARDHCGKRPGVADS